MVSFLSAAARVVRPGGVVALVIGDVEEHGQHVLLAERVWEEMRGLVPFELLEIEVDAYDQTAKTTRVWGEERKGRATSKDRVIVLRRVAGRVLSFGRDRRAGGRVVGGDRIRRLGVVGRVRVGLGASGPGDHRCASLSAAR